MAAPTPISALVHSSTLVTAGLYLMIRYHYVLYESSHLIRCLFVVRIFTSFYAGLNAVFETDFKKLIALSSILASSIKLSGENTPFLYSIRCLLRLNFITLKIGFQKCIMHVTLWQNEVSHNAVR